MTHTFRLRPATRLVIALSGLCLLASCSPGDGSSGGSDDDAIDFISTTSTTASLISTTSTEATTTTTEPVAPSTTEPRWTEEELAVVTAHDEFQFLFVELLQNEGLDPEVIRPLTTPGLGQAIVEIMSERRAGGVTSRGDIELRSIEVIFANENTAEVVACIWDRAERLEDGEVVIPADDEPLEARTSMAQVDGTWRVAAAVEMAGDRPCEL